VLVEFVIVAFVAVKFVGFNVEILKFVIVALVIVPLVELTFVRFPFVPLNVFPAILLPVKFVTVVDARVEEPVTFKFVKIAVRAVNNDEKKFVDVEFVIVPVKEFIPFKVIFPAITFVIVALVNVALFAIKLSVFVVDELVVEA
jgi:hypothetical protein